MPEIEKIDTPAVLIDVSLAEKNLARAQDHITARGMLARPHIKTHKLPRFAHRQIELGATGITCQKLSEAEVMAGHGIDDILITYNILGEGKLGRLRALADKIDLSVCADNAHVVSSLAGAMSGAARPLAVLVECDTGSLRCGVMSPQQALDLALKIDAAQGLEFKGLMTYPPMNKGEETNAKLTAIRDHLNAAGLKVEVISTGGTPDLWDSSPSIATEYRPGTYIYNDIMQIGFGAATLDDCALSVLATVISCPDADRAVLDSGSKTLSSDPCQTPGFGHIVEYPDVVLTHMNEEHGMLNLSGCDPERRPKVGDRVHIIPNHVCVVSNLFNSVYLVQDNGNLEMVPVTARGCLT